MSVPQKISKFKAQYGVAAAFMILALFGGISIEQSASNDADTLYQNQIEACHRGNHIRAQLDPPEDPINCEEVIQKP